MFRITYPAVSYHSMFIFAHPLECLILQGNNLKLVLGMSEDVCNLKRMEHEDQFENRIVAFKTGSLSPAST